MDGWIESSGKLNNKHLDLQKEVKLYSVRLLVIL